jgi:hypothetical protein
MGDDGMAELTDTGARIRPFLGVVITLLTVSALVLFAALLIP